MKDNYDFNDEYFEAIGFTMGPPDIGIPLIWRRAENFEEALDVCQERGLGIAAIEVYKGGFAETRLIDDYGGDAFDSKWYRDSFEELRNEYCDGDDDVLFAATYLEPGDTWPPDHPIRPTRRQTGFWQKLKRLFG